MSAPATIAPFDLGGPLPSGVTLLEASAGTGKTFAIAALAARFVAAGTPLSQLLVVTFTRMATGELRERVRGRLMEAERALGRTLAGAPGGEADEALVPLLEGTPDELVERRRRLAGAIASFDGATIATTHGFCQHVLAGLGVAGDVEPDATFVEDVADLVEEAVDDLFVRRFHRASDAPPFGRAEALRLARAAVDKPHARLVPDPPPRTPGEAAWATRARLAHRVREEVEARKRRLAVLTYDDLLTRLAATLTSEATGPRAAAMLRERYRVVLVDEFQDTDPIQWQILQRAFGDGQTTLVLIGDPKQAIYSFRGADVYAYLEAAQTAAARSTLAVNWRSDEALLAAFDALLGGARLGHEDIVARPVQAAEAHREPRLLGAPAPAPLRVRLLRRGDGLVPLTPRGYARKEAAEDLIARDLAADVVRLLSSAAELVHRSRDGSEEGREPVRPAHLAVLVPTNRHAVVVRDALETAGVPAVINGAGSVFATRAAGDWRRLLEALERPASGPRARALTLTAFLGWSAWRLATADEKALEDVHGRLHRWAGTLRRRGVAALYEQVAAGERLAARVLAHDDGERELTDLRHVAQLLHAAATEQGLGVSSLAAWLGQRIGDAERDAAHEDRTVRLDSDAEAVQVLTIHRSKGLEFPVVYLPFASHGTRIDESDPPAYHDPDEGHRAALDVGGKGAPDFFSHGRRHREERRGEDLRLFYVALTRAQHQVVLWWAGTAASRDSALGRLLLARRDDGTVGTMVSPLPGDDDVAARLDALAARGGGSIAVEVVTAPSALSWSAAPPVAGPLVAAGFTRSLDARWSRTSYSAIVAGAREERVDSEPEQDVVDDEQLSGVPATLDASRTPADEERLRAAALPLAAMPGGVDVGDLVHRVLEATDFHAPDLTSELAARLAEQRRRRDVDIGDAGVLLAGLRAALETPLGTVAGERRLADVARRDRLDELAFELPLAGGDDPWGSVRLTDLASLLEAHLPAGDPLRPYAARLRDRALRRDLRGYLAGSIDLVLRTPGAPGGRYTVVDYKTNRLGTEGEALTAWDYRPAALGEAMQRGHYPLQALLYVVALHRYLRWRLPAYAPAEHLGGVLYLFVRGMTGPATPRVDGQPCGVFAWQPPAALVEELSDLLDRGGPAR